MEAGDVGDAGRLWSDEGCTDGEVRLGWDAVALVRTSADPGPGERSPQAAHASMANATASAAETLPASTP
jgi:hypothetical protein